MFESLFSQPPATFRLSGVVRQVPCTLYVYLKSAANLRNVQMVGKQDPFVRIWTSLSRKGQAPARPLSPNPEPNLMSFRCPMWLL